jgi:tRNA pseudouridine38-40 synthase
MRTWKIILEYEGTRYHGWEEQPNARGVQEVVRTAAEDFFGDKVSIGAAGRTDAGVHALAQAIHLRCRKKKMPREIHYGLNDRLPSDINVLRVDPAPDDFHARHDARRRFYLYQISRRRTAFGKRFVWWVKEPLDVRQMQACAALFSGRRDFRSFCERPETQESTRVNVEQCLVRECGDLILLRFVASHYLWKMVRRLTGAIVEVGKGNWSVSTVKEFLEGSSGEPAKYTAPASGLFFEYVQYPGDPLPGELKPTIWI